MEELTEHKDLYGKIEKFIHDRVWETKKTRMNSEERYLRYNFFSEVILNEYSVCMLALSVITLSKADARFDLLNLVLSILLLGVTLIVTCLRFKETANEYKNSYTQLILIEDQLENLLLKIKEQYLEEDPYDSFLNIKNNYQTILSNTPNHKYIDYLRMKKNSDENKLDTKQTLYYYSRIILGSIVMTGIIILPLALIVYKFLY